MAGLVCELLRVFGITDVSLLEAHPSRPNLVVRIPGEGPGPTLILSGHTDTKPAGDLFRSETDPWDPVVSGGELRGLGSDDMKAAVAAMVYAAVALARAGGWSGELQLVLTADEEGGSTLGSKWLAQEGHLVADAAIIGEPCGVMSEWENIGVVSCGSALVDIEVVGTQMHSSVSDRFDPVNATVEMAWLIQRMASEFHDELTYAPYPLDGSGPTVNVGVMAEAGPLGTNHLVLGRRVEPGVFPGATDALSFQGIAGIPTVAAFGPGYLPRAHAPNERLAVEGVNQAAQIYALAALRYLIGDTGAGKAP